MEYDTSNLFGGVWIGLSPRETKKGLYKEAGYCLPFEEKKTCEEKKTSEERML
ncbi:hypothetical protein ACT8ZS_10805 [Paenibacillus sp. M.A.Huq-84]